VAISPERAERAATRLEPWAAVAALGWCALRLGRGLGPDPMYNSDCAVPLLLMRGLGEGPFTLFYPRQDRYGMWPFLLGRWLHLGTAEAVNVLAVLTLCSALVPLSALLGSPALAVLTLLLPIVLNPSVAWNLFQAGQPYLWQVVTLVWAWWACRSAFVAPTRGRRLAALGGFLVAGFLSAWISSVSLVALLGVLVIEAVHTRARPAWVGEGLVTLGLAALGEGQLRRFYNAFCKRTFGERFITVLRIDRGHLVSNLGAVAATCWRDGIVVPLLLGLGALAAQRLTRSQRASQAVLVALALCSLPAFVLIAHFRENEFAGRYFSFATYWAVAAAGHGVLALAGELAGRRRTLVHLAGLLALVVLVPAGPGNPLGPQRLEAARLVGAAPRVLLGTYWEVYVPASLAPPGALLPLPREGDYNRFPTMAAELQTGREVLVACEMDGPDGTLEQYGALLRRLPGDPVRSESLSWCLHAVERPARPMK